MITSIMHLLFRAGILPSALLLASGPVVGWSAEIPAVEVRLLAFSRVGDDMEVNIQDIAGKPLAKAPVALPTRQLSAPEKVAGRKLVFSSKNDATRILGKIDLPAAGSEFVLVFLPAPKESAHAYHVDAVALPSSQFRSGDYAFVNYSGTAVGCDIAGKRVVVAHGKSMIYQATKAQAGAGNRPLVCYHQKNGAWDPTPFFSGRIIVQDGVRNLVLICLDPLSGEIDFRGIPDFVEWKS